MRNVTAPTARETRQGTLMWSDLGLAQSTLVGLALGHPSASPLRRKQLCRRTGQSTLPPSQLSNESAAGVRPEPASRSAHDTVHYEPQHIQPVTHRSPYTRAIHGCPLGVAATSASTAALREQHGEYATRAMARGADRMRAT